MIPSAPTTTHLHHLAEGHSAVGFGLGERRQLEGREPLGRRPSEGEWLGAHPLEGVGDQASKQDHKCIASYIREEITRVKASLQAQWGWA